MLKNRSGTSPTVLSIYPVTQGFSYVFFLSPRLPHDWGTRQIRKDITGANTVSAVKELVERFRPDVLVLDDPADHRGGLRQGKLTRINKAIARLMGSMGGGVVVISRRKIRSAFAQYGAINKHEIAKVIAGRLDAFATRMPRKPGPNGQKDRRMGLFDAASRALTYYHMQSQLAGDSHGDEA